MLTRRGLIGGLLAAPAIIKLAPLMKISLVPPLIQPRYISFDPIPDYLILPMGIFEVEEDPLDPHRVSALVDTDYVRQLRAVARLVETHFDDLYSD